MGFKLNKTLIIGGNPVSGVGETAPNSLNGSVSLGLPFNRQVGLNTASGLKTDIGTACFGVSKLLRSDNSQFAYTAARSATGSIDFPLEEGIGYQVRVTGPALGPNVQYIVVGSDDPQFAVQLVVAGQPVAGVGEKAPFTSLSGLNQISYKYHATATTASALKNEIGSQCFSVSKFLASNNTLFAYTAARSATGSIDFPLIPGEFYVVRVTGALNVNYIASHY
jgi:hypothetical protein